MVWFALLFADLVWYKISFISCPVAACFVYLCISVTHMAPIFCFDLKSTKADKVHLCDVTGTVSYSHKVICVIKFSVDAVDPLLHQLV